MSIRRFTPSIPTTSTLCSTRNSRKNRMTEIEIKDVKLEDFETLISIKLEIGKCEKLLELADRFLLPTAKRYLALFIAQSDMNKERKLSLADTYDLEILGTIAMNFSQEIQGIHFRCLFF
ncbi:hypothetical protein L5515_009614 [Caenorhabditis briggsae]|uniref:Uncharacterized protein n=1 Tax=Caenorhabditis briggsae TaxID=6238 RepID=A0AAE9FAV2_CAEBR|nr:hypothetical protein L5515_009614 [Caenorhabditis briggsae]